MLNTPVNSKIQGLFKAFASFSSTFQGKFTFQGLFKTILYIQVLFKPVGTLIHSSLLTHSSLLLTHRFSFQDFLSVKCVYFHRDQLKDMFWVLKRTVSHMLWLRNEKMNFPPGFIQARLCKIQGLLKDFPTIFRD